MDYFPPEWDDIDSRHFDILEKELGGDFHSAPLDVLDAAVRAMRKAAHYAPAAPAEAKPIADPRWDASLWRTRHNPPKPEPVIESVTVGGKELYRRPKDWRDVPVTAGDIVDTLNRLEPNLAADIEDAARAKAAI